MLSSYARRWRIFHPNIRAFLVFDTCYQLALTVYGLYFPRYLIALGHAEDTLGSLMAAGTICIALFSLGAGILSDRIGRRRSLIFGVSISKAAFLLRGFLIALPALYGCYIVDGIFITMYSAAGTPFIFENTASEDRIHAFSIQGMIVRASGIVGNTAGGLLPRLILAVSPGLDDIAVYRTVFVLSVLLAFAGVRQLYAIREPLAPAAALAETAAAHPTVVAAPNGGDSSLPSAPRLARLRANFPWTRAELVFLVQYTVTASLVSMGANHVLPFMNTFLIRTFDAGPDVVGVVLSAAQLATLLGIMVAPALGARFGITPSVLVTRLMALPMLLVMAFSRQLWLVAAAYSFRNGLHQMSAPLTNTFMLAHLSRKTRATANGFLQSFQNGVSALSMFTSGLIITRYGYRTSFEVAMCAYALSAFFFWLFFVRGSAVARERSLDGETAVAGR